MKKIFASILVITMLVCCLSISASAVDPHAKLSIADVTAKPGDTVTIEVQLSESTGLFSGGVKVSCSQLTPTRIRMGTAWNESTDSDNVGNSTVNVAAGIYNWYCSEINATASGVYCTYTFKVADDAKNGEYPITIIQANDEVEFMGYGDVKFDPIFVGATLTIEGGEDPVDPGTDDPGTDNPGTDDPGTDNPGTDDPGTDNPGTDDPGTDNPGTDDPGTDNPGTDDPGTDNPGTDDPGTDNPGTDDPGTDNPGTDDPGTDNPGTDDPTDKPEDKDDDKKEDEKKDDTTKTGDSTNLYIYLAICLFAAAAIVGVSYEIKKNRG